MYKKAKYLAVNDIVVLSGEEKFEVKRISHTEYTIIAYGFINADPTYVRKTYCYHDSVELCTLPKNKKITFSTVVEFLKKWHII